MEPSTSAKVPEQHEEEREQQQFRSYPGKVVVHGRATERAKITSKYKRAYLIVRERWNEAQHETVEIKDKIKKAQSALTEVNNENDVLLEALMKCDPELAQKYLLDCQHQQQQQQHQDQHFIEQTTHIPQDPQYLRNEAEQLPVNTIQHDRFAHILNQEPEKPHNTMNPFEQEQLHYSLQVQPTVNNSKRSIDDIISSSDINEEAKRQRS
ncbi:hypothetical protein E3Q22_01937 [Wallemia mellicola]|uniref:Uncharacterized protein n=2 Tax=Wallemia mellicola TaxID=1708541 RepID=I4YI60_WALMC|nr:hypothetical protein WALSEDRAFT_59309 [Wallemia mellicola CBS 633.66]TIB80454.1 hypothetical protein E3Q22_01937 [Wallemia mellicola]EIM23652.1 hypothetical protein WALSEDRAFT_59309 [Wallemia mellicola CBS 633.66]TIB89344.1 hypothetical protein E3Q19_03066 [Wallemia mellicola]TIB90457.1 hypothetical protein E3Q21_00324 [Wallemia mellicola]TIB92157.1 hypothetical protein E3Q20_00356 [Wallemia mellicola]|eukprot:XP_006956320.1 hypothetical protein WALSEDRAFT_59309 [Wallemia mellicola CBS 633.66]